MSSIERAMPDLRRSSKRLVCASPPVAMCLPWWLEIADPVAILASDAASCITVEIVVVDGGRLMLNYTVLV